MRRTFFMIVLIVMVICCRQTHAALFGDNMVLQRGIELPVWGLDCEKGEKVTVEFNGVSKSAQADENGKWIVKMGPFQAGGPYEMKIIRKSKVTVLKNIMIGEVWICSGQSNMQWTLKKMNNANTEIEDAKYSDIRFLTIQGTAGSRRLKIPSGSLNWYECTPETAGELSAVAYFFGRELYKKLKVPVGLIVTAQGSSPIRSWISREAMEANPIFKETLEEYKTFPQRKKAYAEKRTAYDKALAKSRKDGTKPLPWPGSFENEPTPGHYFYARVYPLAPFGIRGVIWYQGENDAMFKHARTYKDFFPAMINEWRSLWGYDFPFLYVQLAPLSKEPKNPVESSWAEVCDAQRQTMKMPGTAMIVTSDICEVSLHPKNKTDVGKRLAIAAEALAYGKKNIVYSGPIFDKVRFADEKARISFTHIAGGLVLKGDKLKCFTIAGADRKFFNADAKIEGNTVIVHSDKVKNPKAVRYAWSQNLTGNLFNKEGFPASCFRTDDWYR